MKNLSNATIRILQPEYGNGKEAAIAVGKDIVTLTIFEETGKDCNGKCTKKHYGLSPIHNDGKYSRLIYDTLNDSLILKANHGRDIYIFDYEIVNQDLEKEAEHPALETDNTMIVSSEGGNLKAIQEHLAAGGKIKVESTSQLFTGEAIIIKNFLMNSLKIMELI